MSEHFIPRAEAESDLLACAAYIAESIAGGEARGEAIAAIVPAYLERGNMDLAAELANSVDDPFSRDRLLIAVAEKCAELDDDEYALQLAEAIEEPGFQAQGFEHVGLVKASKGQFETARQAAEMMPHPDSVIAGIAIKQSLDGDGASASSTIDEIEFSRAAVSALNTIAATKISAEEHDTAVELLEKSLARAAEIEHDEERIRSYCEIGNLFHEAGRSSRAIETFEKARVDAEQVENIHRDTLLAQVSLGFLTAGSIELADRALDAVSDKTQIASVVLGFARDHWRREEKEEAVEALEEAYAILRSQRDFETRDSKSKFGLMGSIAAQFAGFEKRERGLEVAESIEDGGQRSAALATVAAIAAGQGDEATGGQALNAIAEPSDRVFALIGMSDAVNKTDAALASELLDRSERMTDEVAQFGPKADALIEIGKRRIRAGEIDGIRSLISQIIEVVSNMRSETGVVKTLAQLSSLTESAGLKLSEEDEARLRAML
jgi:tetratricopeptide (TPR) repeat protein